MTTYNFRNYPNHWVCDGCGKAFSIIDQQPTVERLQEKIDITVFGDTKRKYLTVEQVARRFCSACAP